MAVTLTMDDISYSPGGQMEVNYTWNGEAHHGRGFANADQIVEYFMTIESDEEFALRMILAWWHKRNAALDDEDRINGKTLTLDMAAAQPVKVQ